MRIYPTSIRAMLRGEPPAEFLSDADWMDAQLGRIHARTRGWLPGDWWGPRRAYEALDERDVAIERLRRLTAERDRLAEHAENLANQLRDCRANAGRALGTRGHTPDALIAWDEYRAALADLDEGEQ